MFDYPTTALVRPVYECLIQKQCSQNIHHVDLASSPDGSWTTCQEVKALAPVSLNEYVHSQWEVGHNKCWGEWMIWLRCEPVHRVNESRQMTPSYICSL